MSWSRFRYICRKACSEVGENESIKPCLERIESEQEVRLYGGHISFISLAGHLLWSIKNLEEGQARRAIETYKNLRLDDAHVQLNGLKRAFGYLALVVIVFYLVLSIYQAKVFPVFIETYQLMSYSVPKPMSFFLSYSGGLITLLLVLSIVMLCVFVGVNRVFKFESHSEKRFLFKYFLSPKIKRAYRNLIEIIQFPVELNSSSGVFGQHLAKVYSSNMDLLTEMQELIDLEIAKLVAACYAQLKIITTIVGIVITVCVFFLLYCAYLPIFVAGEMV